MNELVEWLRTQLDDDDRAALAVSDGPNKPEQWRVEQYKDDPRGYRVAGQHSVVIDGAFGPDAAHMVRHDPARVLREVEAKRRILDECAESGSCSGPCLQSDYCDCELDEFKARVVRLLALPYSDRPGYRSEWAPSDT